MSFFGFDTTLPADLTLDDRINALKGASGQDLTIYEFGDSLGLDEEDVNGLNDETFGADIDLESSTLGQDFDFAGSTSRFLGQPSGGTTGFTSTKPVAKSSVKTSTAQSSKDWATTDPLLGFDDDEDPLLSTRGAKKPLKSSNDAYHSSTSYRSDSPPVKKPQIRTLEDIEAELLANAANNRPFSKPPVNALTLAEVEAEMLAKAGQTRTQTTQGLSYFQSGRDTSSYIPTTLPSRLHSSQSIHSRIPSLQHSMITTQQFPPSLNDRHRIVTPDLMETYASGLSQQQRQQQQHYLQYREQQRGSPVPASNQVDQYGRSFTHRSQLSGSGRPMDRTFYETEQSFGDGPGHSRASSSDFQQPRGPISHPLQIQQMQQLQQMGLTPAQFQIQFRQQQLQSQYQMQMLANAQIQRNMQVALEREGLQSVDVKDQRKEDPMRNTQVTLEQQEHLEKRRRKAQKIAEMAKYNNLMTQSDKDFITRIQVSQLVTEDPYKDDFYYQVLKGIKLQQAQVQGSPTKEANDHSRRGRSQSNAANRRLTRRENAMAKMAQQVQRLVNEAKKKPRGTELSLDGALGKIALRTASQPRQLLQVPVSPVTPKDEKKPVSTAVEVTPTEGQKPALSRRQVLTALEKLWDIILDLEQLVRTNMIAKRKWVEESGEKLTQNEEKEVNEWQLKYTELCQLLWTELRILDPLDMSNPHPFISLLSVSKGKRLLARAVRHLSEEQTMTMLSLLVGNFESLDVVRDASILDISDPLLAAANRVVEVEMETDVFQSTIVPLMISIVERMTSLRYVTGLLHVMMQRNNVVKVATTRPGLAFLITFISKAETLKQSQPPPDGSDIEQWQRTFDQLFLSLHSHLLELFPSSRALANLPFGSSYYLSGALQSQPIRPDIDLEDEPVWQFLAACAICADADQQQILVTEVREKVLEIVHAVHRVGGGTEEEKALKLRNVNILLNSLGLDSSMINVE